MFDRQPQGWAYRPGVGTFQHTVSPTKTKEKEKGDPGDAKQGKGQARHPVTPPAHVERRLEKRFFEPLQRYDYS